MTEGCECKAAKWPTTACGRKALQWVHSELCSCNRQQGECLRAQGYCLANLFWHGNHKQKEGGVNGRAAAPVELHMQGGSCGRQQSHLQTDGRDLVPIHWESCGPAQQRRCASCRRSHGGLAICTSASGRRTAHSRPSARKFSFATRPGGPASDQATRTGRGTACGCTAFDRGSCVHFEEIGQTVIAHHQVHRHCSTAGSCASWQTGLRRA